MIVVLDTNVVIQALNPHHDYAPIMDEWYGGRFVWALFTDIPSIIQLRVACPTPEHVGIELREVLNTHREAAQAFEMLMCCAVPLAFLTPPNLQTIISR